MLNYST